MNAMVEPQAFVLPKKPRVKEKEAPPDQRSLAVLPIRAGRDQRLHGATLRCLIVLCSYCNRAGITWVGQAKLAQDLGISRQAVTKQLKLLIQTGYVEVIKKGFRAERANTIRVIFDKSVDADTAIAITSAQENTRPPSMQDETPDPEGQRRIAQLLARALKQPVTKKEYTMPKTGQTRTVQKMHEEIKQHKAKRSAKSSHTQPPEVANEEPSIGNLESKKTASIGNPQRLPHRQPSEVAQTPKEHSYIQPYVLGNLERVELKKAGLNDQQIDDNLAHLLDAYQAEGMTPAPERLVGEILQLAKVGL